MNDFFEDYLNDVHDETCQEYEFDRDMVEKDIEPELTEIINDDDVPLDPTTLGMALGLAEEIAEEDRYQEIETTPFKTERDIPAGSTLVSFKPTKTVKQGRGKFESYVDNLIAENRSKLPV